MIEYKNGTVSFAPSDKHKNAAIFEINMNKDDGTFSIKKTWKNSKNVTTTTYLQEHNNKVDFKPPHNPQSRWKIQTDKASGAFFIRNKISENTLYVDSKGNYAVNTVVQTLNKASLFKLERPFYIELGCFKNKIGKQLQHYMAADNSLTTESCFQACEASGKTYTHFGMTEGKQCFCGTSFSKDKAPYSDCGYLCKGRGGDLCGGNFRTLIYKKKKEKPVVIDDEWEWVFEPADQEKEKESDEEE